MNHATDQLDARLRTHLRRKHDHPPTVGDIHDATGIPPSSIRASIRRLTNAGEVEQAGIGTNGARTWRLTPVRITEAHCPHHSAQPATPATYAQSNEPSNQGVTDDARSERPA